MDRFLDYYFEDNTLVLPIDLDLCSINERGEIEIGIPYKYLSQLVEYDVIRLSRNGKTFKSLEEAYEHYDSLDEAEKKEKVDKKRTKVQDPETGEERDFEVAAGNAKIGGDTVLLNMSTAGNCMSAIIGTCKLATDGRCYAFRFEQQWKDSKEKNIRHEKQWACLTPRGIAQGLANISEAMPKIKYVRINEAGELRNLPSNPELLAKVPDEKKAELADVDDVGKLKSVGEELIRMGSKLILYTYTHRSDLEIGDLGPNVCINGSGYMLDNAFIPVELDEFNRVMDLIETKSLKEFNGEPVTRGVHCLGDCRKCNFCKKKDGKHIFLPIHGSGTEYQNTLQQILTSVVESPAFKEAMATGGKPKEIGEILVNSIPDENKKLFNRLVPIRQDRVDLFSDIIKNTGNSETLVKSLEKYISGQEVGDGAVEVDVSEEDSILGLAASVDALTGKFQANIERAISKGQEPAQKKWGALINALNNAMESVRRGETPKVTKALAKQHAGVLKRLQKDLGRKE